VAHKKQKMSAAKVKDETGENKAAGRFFGRLHFILFLQETTDGPGQALWQLAFTVDIHFFSKLYL
tara:strand:+ start:648 stop:842 length:195 start_codon:yes stop_codon:yes gene_type:complete